MGTYFVLLKRKKQTGGVPWGQVERQLGITRHTAFWF
jgi:hypothetical protein